MRILVTGGAGYLGSVLVPGLLELGHEVTVLDNFMYRQSSLNNVCWHPKFFVEKGDIRIKDTVKRLMAAVDVVIPLAALVGAPLCNIDPVGARSINRDAILMMLDLLAEDQIVLMPTTNSAYGSGEDDKTNLAAQDTPHSWSADTEAGDEEDGGNEVSS